MLEAQAVEEPATGDGEALTEPRRLPAPARSAIMAQFSSRIGFRFLAWKRTSSSVSGTKPQFSPPASL